MKAENSQLQTEVNSLKDEIADLNEELNKLSKSDGESSQLAKEEKDRMLK